MSMCVCLQKRKEKKNRDSETSKKTEHSGFWHSLRAQKKRLELKSQHKPEYYLIHKRGILVFVLQDIPTN